MPAHKPTVLGLAPSFGYGDRTGLATPGHVAAQKRAGGSIKPIFAQQSIREMSRTKRTPTDVMSAAIKGLNDTGYVGVNGADADHLKVPADVEYTAAAGFTFFTIDPSDDVDPKTDDYSPAELKDKFAAIRGEAAWFDAYKGKSIKLATGTTITLDENALMRAAVKYGKAINRTVRLARHIEAVNKTIGRDYEIELSVDETPQPTTLAEHWIVAEQCLKNGMKLVSLAPRYIGEFEKGVDYKGDMNAFEKSFADHAAIARQLGPYKLSLHSGSDKLSIYTAFARITKGMLHVKTAGTSYLEALRVVARHDESLFRRIVDFARARYDTDKATYHVSATVAGTPAPAAIKDIRQLEEIYLETWPNVKPGAGFTQPGRQILHCTFGSTLTDPVLGPAVRAVLVAHPGTYNEVLADHFAKHLEALNKGMQREGRTMDGWYISRQGQQTGPFTLDQLRQMQAAGQLLPHDMVWRQGQAQWAPAQFVTGLWQAPPAGYAPQPGYGPPQGAYYGAPPGGYYPQPSPGDDAGMRWLLPVGRSGWAIAAGYLGLLSFVVFPAPLALILSIVALIDLRRHPEKHGQGRAIFGLVMGILGTLVLVLMLIGMAASTTVRHM